MKPPFFVLLAFLAETAGAVGIPMLCYHTISPTPQAEYTVSTEAFMIQMNYLAKEGYQGLSVAQLVEGIKKKSLPEKGVVISIDDGDQSAYFVAWPVMKQAKLPCSLYVYTSRIDRQRGLTRAQLIEMAQGGVEIGCHTKTHPHLTPPKKMKSWKKLTNLQLKDEIVGSKQVLENWLSQSVRFLAYPYGLYNQEVEDLAVHAGYEAMLTLDGGNNTVDTSPYRLKRKQVFRTTTLEKFVKLLK